MKKITLLTLLLVLPFFGIAQGPWEFTTASTDYTDWSKGACSDNQTDGVWELTTNGSNNPNITNVTASVNADANQFASVTLRLSAGGPSYMRLRMPKAGGGFTYRAVVIDPSETDYVTYYIDASASDWTGTVNDIRFQFKDNDGTIGGANHTSTGETIEIGRIEFVNVVPRPEKLVYEFDTAGDDEGFSTLVDATSVVAGGNLTITPSAPGTEIAKVTNGVNSVDASVNTHMHIVYQNLSADNNQLRVQFRSSVDNYLAFTGTNTAINQSMAAFETISLDLATLKPVEWTGTAQDIQLAIRNTANAGNASSAGDFVIDRIVFNNASTLSVDDLMLSNFTIYPNPAKNIISIAGNIDLNSVSIFDITGKKVLEKHNLTNNTINVSNLNSGVYLLRLENINGGIVAKKFIKN